ncbi:MAG: alpha/beta hydrolase [Thermoguttaceae bacterium]
MKSDKHFERLYVNRLSDDGKRWNDGNVDDFFATHDPTIPLVIIIHGNWMKLSDAKVHGIKFHQLAKDRGDFRLLVWSWPSERELRNIREDAKLKASRADVQARFLAEFLRRLPVQSKVSLIGFSFGAKLASETLQLIAKTAEVSSEDSVLVEHGNIGHSLRLRTVLLGAAMDQQSLGIGHQYGLALSATEKMLIHVNNEDKTLCYYPLLVGLRGPQAIGKKGVSLAGMPQNYRNKIKSVNANPVLGNQHGFMFALRGLLAFKNDFRHFALFE